jgi:hypothetical protein
MQFPADRRGQAAGTGTHPIHRPTQFAAVRLNALVSKDGEMTVEWSRMQAR